VNKMKEIKKTLFMFLIPTLSGMLITFMFQLVDTYFIGQLGTENLAAIGFVYPIYLGLISIFIGLSAGIGATIGFAHGAKDIHKKRNLAQSGLHFSIVLSGVIIGITYFFRHTLYGLLGADYQTQVILDPYMRILLLGMPLLFVAINGTAALRAIGRAIAPELIMAIGGIINLILDYVLIFGRAGFPAYGIAGAAIATVISWGIVFILILSLLIKEGLLRLRIRWRDLYSALREILEIGLAVMVVQIIVPIATAVITAFVASQSMVSVAAFGIASKIESLGLTLILALSTVLVPILSQQAGEKNDKKMEFTIAYVGKITIWWSIGLYGLLLISSRQMASLFSSDPQVILQVSRYLLIVGLAYPFLNLTTVTLSIFNALSLSKVSLQLTLIKYVVILLPALLLGQLLGIWGIFLGLMLTHLLGGLMTIRRYREWLKEKDADIAKVNLLEEYKSDIYNLFKGGVKNHVN
jgi:putative MATE family efflux protein